MVFSMHAKIQFGSSTYQSLHLDRSTTNGQAGISLFSSFISLICTRITWTYDTHTHLLVDWIHTTKGRCYQKRWIYWANRTCIRTQATQVPYRLRQIELWQLLNVPAMVSSQRTLKRYRPITVGIPDRT
jgi:hypothetical protein